MLPVDLVHEIARLLRDGKNSQRQIAKKLKVSRGIVSAIAHGRRGLHGRETTGPNADPFALNGLPERCPTCGGNVFMPCVLCNAREYRASRHRKNDSATNESWKQVA